MAKAVDVNVNDWFMVKDGRFRMQWFKKVRTNDDGTVVATQVGKYHDFKFEPNTEVVIRK